MWDIVLEASGVELDAGPVLGMFEVFGRAGSPTLGRPPFLTLKIPYKLTFILPLIAKLTKEPEML